MSGLNKALIIGRLGADPELRFTPNGKAVCNFNVATSEVFTKDGEKQESTEWHRIVLWGKPAENAAKYLSKGKQVYIEGKLQTRQWDDRDGNKRYTTEIVGNMWQNLSPADGPGHKNESGDQSSDIPGSADDFDVPF